MQLYRIKKAIKICSSWDLPRDSFDFRGEICCLDDNSI